jgi:hypothetical protein
MAGPRSTPPEDRLGGHAQGPADAGRGLAQLPDAQVTHRIASRRDVPPPAPSGQLGWGHLPGRGDPHQHCGEVAGPRPRGGRGLAPDPGHAVAAAEDPFIARPPRPAPA